MSKIQAKKPVMDADLKKNAEAKAQAGAETPPVEPAPAPVAPPVEPAPAATEEVKKEEVAEDAKGEEPKEVTDVAPAAEAPPVEPAPEAAPAPVAETKQPEEKPAEVTSEELVYLDNVSVNGTVAQKRILVALKNFIESLTPGRPAIPAELVKAQNLFLDHLLWALDRPDPSEFKQVWSVLLVGFKAYHGEGNSPSKGYSSLSEYRAGVYSDLWTDEDRLGCYLNLVTLLRHTRNVATRAKDVKRIKLDAISDVLVTDSRLDNLKRFYAV